MGKGRAWEMCTESLKVERTWDIDLVRTPRWGTRARIVRPRRRAAEGRGDDPVEITT